MRTLTRKASEHSNNDLYSTPAGRLCVSHPADAVAFLLTGEVVRSCHGTWHASCSIGHSLARIVAAPGKSARADEVATSEAHGSHTGDAIKARAH